MKEDEAKEIESPALESETVEPKAVAVDEAVVAEVPAADGPAKRRPLWLHLIVVVLQTLLLVPVYAGVVLAAVLAGVGWHYYDASERLDMGLVDRPEIGALVRDVRGEVIGRAGSKNRILIQRDEIPAHFVDALIAAEDQRFFAHPGFDPVGSVRAAWANYRAEAIREGGSTLTQQLARDVYQLEGKDMDRKLSEIAASVRIEQRYSKDEILVHYLNRVYFGSGFYGLGSAARGYFGKRVSELTLDESALICGVIPSPSRYSPFVNPARAREYRDQTLRRMVDTGKLDAKLLDGLLAKETPVASSRADSIERGQVTYLLGRIERELRADMKRWPEQPETLDGYVIDTSVDLALQ
ncbi:MAG TPA: biosynthetic peptidoglycan transglycosylase, partial [Bacteroidia bacterium]|nr:biosynthetic peptidoglycan transglycosylase [Bacteroidia bacterium]